MKKIILYNDNNYIIKLKIFYNKFYMTITPYLFKLNPKRIKLNKFIYKYWYITYNFYWLRVTWRGKAYRIRFFRKKRKFTFNFGHSHWSKLIYNINKYIVRKFRRRNYFFCFKEKSLLKEMFETFILIKKYNKYTLRGVRIKQKFIIRRFGKVGYNMLHDY